MDSAYLIVIVVSGIIGIAIGAAIGYLLGGRKDSGLKAEKAVAESRALELQKQLDQKGIEISRREDEIKRQQQSLIESQTARSEAETKLAEARNDIEELREGSEAKDLEILSYRNAFNAAEKKSVELQARNDAIIQQLNEQKQFIAEADVKLREAFESLSSEALRRNNTAFLETAKETLESKVKESASELETRKAAIETLVKPLSESLKNFDGKISEIELKREGAYSEMKTLLSAMKDTATNLDLGTKQLVSALKTSHVRGKYGEISLRRVVEVAGLSPHCDFAEQVSVNTEAGKLRPDMTIELPGHRRLILDAKVPLAAYMRAFETDDEAVRAACMKEHAEAVRKHLKELSQKTYWDQFDDAPDFVIMYLQIESSFGAALMAQPTLIEEGINNQIVMATPSTLITMLRTVGFMWQQEKMAEGVKEMQLAALELYKRANTMLTHFSKIGNGLNSVVGSYNDAVASMEKRVVVQMERIKEIGGTLAKDDIPAMKPVEKAIKSVTKELPSGNEIETDIVNRRHDS